MIDSTIPKTAPAPPNWIKSLAAGFDTVSNHIGLILFSIVFDVLLWIAPHLSLHRLLASSFSQVTTVPEMQSPEMVQMLSLSQEFWLNFAKRFNLLGAVRTLPIGIPSLMVVRTPIETPVGTPAFWEIPSWGIAIGLAILFVALGIIVGSFFFKLVAQAAVEGEVSWHQAFTQWAWISTQVLLLTLFALLLLLTFMLPFSCLISGLLLSGFGLQRYTSLILILFMSLIIWWLFPLVFSPHGIFVFRLKMWNSVRKGIRLTRMTLPTTGLLFLSIVVINKGLDYLWRLPPEASWLTLIGIAAHAFVTTSLLAASFIYYRDADLWVQGVIRKAVLNSM